MISKYAEYKLRHCDSYLKCRDGGSGREYRMPCLVLSSRPYSNKTGVSRVLVFGDRNSNYIDTLKTMRVVDKDRVVRK